MRKSIANIKDHATDAAEACIQAHGMKGVNARHIAKDIGCAVGTLYNHFSSIDELILAVNLRTLSKLDEALQSASHNTSTGNQGMQAIAEAYINFALEHTHAWQTLFDHRMPKHADIPAIYFQQRQQLFQHIETQMQRAHPHMNDEKIKLESRALWSGIQGVCVLAINKKLDDDHIPFQAIATTLIQHFLNQQGE